MSAIQDKKIAIIYDNYKDNLYAKNAQQEVESIRNRATYLGAGISTAAFVANEIARLSMRSPLFKLKAQNVLAVAILPTLLTRLNGSEAVEKRIENMWRVHKNRVDRGLGGTFKANSHHESLKQDHQFVVPNVTISSEMLKNGSVSKQIIDNPFIRQHQSMVDYPSHLSDIDDHAKNFFDEFERLKPTKPSKKHHVGNVPLIPKQDNDEAFEYYDIQGESLYTNPPDQNVALVDSGMDEEYIWAFGRDLYNQVVVKNPYHDTFSRANTLSHIPHWSSKMKEPHFFKREKMDKLMRHWDHRKGLEALKMKHAVVYGRFPTEQQKEAMTAEISNYIDACYQYEADYKTKDLAVTDHVKQEAKLITSSEAEDEEFFNYEQSVAEYNATGSSHDLKGARETASRYVRGSLMQRLVDPFDGAARDQDGAIVYKVTEEELARFESMDEETLKRAFESGKGKTYDAWDVDEEDEEAFRLGLVAELESGETEFDVEKMHEHLSKELGVFKEQEKYSVVKDLKEAYQNSLSKTSEQRIMETIPAHAFWDIKKPLKKAPFVRENRYNPFRGAEYNNFFEMRDAEEYFRRQEEKDNRNPSVSLHKRY